MTHYTISSFLTKAGSACSILIAVYVSGGYEKRPQVAWFHSIWGRSPAPNAMVCTTFLYTARISLVRININLNAHQHVSDILCPMVVAYLRGLPNSIFQQDNVRLCVARHVLTIFDTRGIRMLSWATRSADRSLIQNIRLRRE